MYRMIVSDIDGTILRNDKTISVKVKETVHKLIDDDKKFIIATGRVFSAAKWAYMDLEINGPIIACNGALIKDTLTGEILYERPLDKEKAKKVVKICKEYDLYFHFYSEDAIYAEKYEHIIKAYGEKSKELPDNRKIKVEVIHDSLNFIDEIDKIYKIGIFLDLEESCDNIVSKIESIEGISSYKSLATSFDVMEEGVSKGNAIKELNRIFGISKEETIAVGDNENDMSMIIYSGLGVAMGNAIDQVKAVADYVTDDNENDGFYTMIEKNVYL
jgi:Cof subfamily protein (haloacid dehalogenase superfamily)